MGKIKVFAHMGMVNNSVEESHVRSSVVIWRAQGDRRIPEKIVNSFSSESRGIKILASASRVSPSVPFEVTGKGMNILTEYHVLHQQKNHNFRLSK
jgi:hypothetical protein